MLDGQLAFAWTSTETEDAAPGQVLVKQGATVAGGTGDALIELSWDEHRRRADSGLGAVTAPGLLDRLLNLPPGHLVPWDALGPELAGAYQLAPPGVVELSEAGVQRMLVAPATVRRVIVRSSTWRAGLQRAAAFAAFAERELVLTRSLDCDLDAVLWEADTLGVGVSLAHPDGDEQILAPRSWQQRYIKAAGWAFQERTYGAWLKAAQRPLRP